MKPYSYFFLMIISLLILVHLNENSKSLIRFFTKLVTSLFFVIIAYSAYQESVYNFYCLFIFLGLSFALIGDIFLGIKYLNIKIMFILGIACFMLTHIFYSLAFIYLVPISINDIVCTIALSFIIIFTYISIDGFNFRNSFFIVCIYIVIICFMLFKAISLIRIEISATATFFTILGAFLFTLSDIVLSFVYFYNNSPKFLSNLNLVLYYLGQGFIALSILYI
ncbi:hypothetical protein CHL78_005275 [Romboutsia weinsteinii]|uniref:Lysoplasmalogenase n=1 Tax=Romboutsia weinsteinii TaxID=2020949 RepID=A0A371J6D3_9FIRM|nr:hypothetical protein CHL78_005275 [Romboutsia weinsteinii]